MNEFAEMLKEAFVGEAPFESTPPRAAIEASIRKFEKRMRTVRFMAWFGAAFGGLVMLVALVRLIQLPPDTNFKTLLLYAVAFFWGLGITGMIKMWLFIMQNDIGMRKELKRVQLMLIDRDAKDA